MQRRRFLAAVFFSLILYIFFVIPPLTVSYEAAINSETALPFSNWTFPFRESINFLFFIVLYIFFTNPDFFKGDYKNKKIAGSKSYIFVSMSLPVFYFLITLGSLLVISSILNLTASFFHQTIKINIEKPKGLGILFCVLSFFFQSFNEEFLYRFFIPSTKLLLSKQNENRSSENAGEVENRASEQSDVKVNQSSEKSEDEENKAGECKEKELPSKKIKSSKMDTFLAIFLEIFSAIIFAFSHRYLGLFSVINALLAHIVLRHTFRKSGSILPGSLAHGFYNLLSLLFTVA